MSTYQGEFEEVFQKMVLLLATINDQIIDSNETDEYQTFRFNCSDISKLNDKLAFISSITKLDIKKVSVDENGVVLLRVYK